MTHAVPCLVAELPYAPSNVRISEITATSVHISWHYDGPPSETVEFVIQYKPKMAAPTSDYSEMVGLKTNYYTVQHLSPFTEYEFVVVAVSAIGRGLPSTATFVTTGETGNSILALFELLWPSPPAGRVATGVGGGR